jgi:hypothetical protein
MPTAEYETRTDSVLAWKKAQKLGRFDPEAPSIEQQKLQASEREVEERGKSHFFFSSQVYLHSLISLWRRRHRSSEVIFARETMSFGRFPVGGCMLVPICLGQLHIGSRTR